MPPALLACLCACSAICVLFKRGGREGRLRRILAFTALSMSALLLLWSLLQISTQSELEGMSCCNTRTTLYLHHNILFVELEQFVDSAVNCSEYTEHGPVGVATRHQWFHAVGYSLDDLRTHWAFPEHPNVCGPVAREGEV